LLVILKVQILGVHGLALYLLKAKDKERRIVSDEDDEIMVLVQSVYFHLRSLVSRVIEISTKYI